jgi:hypothetical protein
MKVYGQLHILTTLTPGKEKWYTLERKLGWPHSQHGCSGKEKKSLPGNETQSFSPYPSRYTD